MQYNHFLQQKRKYPLQIYKEKAEQLIKEGHDIIDLTIGDPKGDTYDKVYTKASQLTEDMNMSQYPKSRGDKEYLQAVASWAKRNHNLSLNIDKHILSCNGSKEAIFHLPLLFDWNNNKEIFIPSLSYPVYQASAELFNIPIKFLPLKEENNFLANLDDITDEEWQKCQVFWINSPHNPTTSIASKEYFTKLLALAEKYNFLVCSDECYNDTCYTDKIYSALDFPESKNWLVFRSLSKRSHMTGFRIGAMISCNEELIRKMALLRLPIGVGTPTFIQKAALHAWQDDEHAVQNSLDYQAKRDIIKQALEEKGFHIFGAMATFYFWFSHPQYPTSESLCNLFLEYDIVITPGSAFGKDGEGYCRMVYCESMKICQKLVKRINTISLTK